MSVLQRVLVVGGGIGGMAAALCLRKLGAQVDLIEIDPAWKVYGAGITVGGAALRAIADLGLLPQLCEHGDVRKGLDLLDVHGNLLMHHESPSDALVAHGGGIMRPALHAIMSQATRASGVNVHLGVTVEQLTQSPRTVSVLQSSGVRADFDLVVAADGIGSVLRRKVFPDAPEPRFTGQGCWRLTAERPQTQRFASLYVGGPSSLGFIPVSATHMYMFLVENLEQNARSDEADHPARVRGLLEPYGGVAAAVRDGISRESCIVYRPLEALLMPRPWLRGRIVLLGDAAHATTPHLAAGAGMAIEDALVLTEELWHAADVEQALAAYETRRYERCRAVVENSVQIGRYQREGAAPDKAIALMQRSLAQLAQPY